MVVKGIILGIDYVGNTCTVRMPYFESTGGGEVAVATATFSNTPGCFNGYKENDVVFVAFEDGQAQTPVVIGKLYLGAAAEAQEARGAISCQNLKASQTSALPADTSIVFNPGSDVIVAEGAAGSHGTILNAISNLQTLITKLTKQVEQLTSRIEELEQQNN